MLTVPSLPEAMKKVDELWDNIFPYNNQEGGREHFVPSDVADAPGNVSSGRFRSKSRFFNALFS